MRQTWRQTILISFINLRLFNIPEAQEAADK